MAKIEINEQKLIELYNQNILIKDMADYFNCSRDTITRRLKKFGLKLGKSYKQKQPKTDRLLDKKLKIKDLYLEGKTMKEIGKLLELSEKTIGYHLRKLNVEIRPTKKVDQQKFEELWIEGKTDEEIADYFGVEISTIKTFRTRGENVGKFNKIRYFSQTEQQLSYLQEQFVLGSLLGDLNLTKVDEKHNNSRLSIVQCEQQKELFMKKVEMLDIFMGSYQLIVPKPDPRTGKIYKSYRGNSKAHQVFTDIYNKLYINGTKTITSSYLNSITHPIALAYWFMDDGTNRGTFATNSFTENEIDLLIEWMDHTWKIKCTKQRNLKNFVIHLSSKSRLDFEQLVFPYMIPSMYYKLKFLDILQAQSV